MSLVSLIVQCLFIAFYIVFEIGYDTVSFSICSGKTRRDSANQVWITTEYGRQI